MQESYNFISNIKSGIMAFFIRGKPMPLYEYKCTKCGSVFESLQKVNDPPLKKCIHCHGPVKKLLSPPALQFKGSGWYVTDYASKGNQTSNSKPKDAPKKDKGGSSDKKSPPSSPAEKK
jgi:putative FmdB family regulatory protein